MKKVPRPLRCLYVRIRFAKSVVVVRVPCRSNEHQPIYDQLMCVSRYKFENNPDMLVARGTFYG